MIETRPKMDNKSEKLTKSNQQNDIYNYNLDHVYCSDNASYRNAAVNSATGDVKTLRKENKQLQAMLLLNLDLIQEQSNQIIAKDKQLLQLREENEQLRTRCERGERRTSKGNTCAGGKPNNSPTIDTYFTVGGGGSPQNRLDESNRIKTLASRLSDAEKRGAESEAKPAGEKEVNAVNYKERATFEKYAFAKGRPNENSVIGNNNGKLISKIILQRKQSETGEKIFIRAKNVEVDSHRAGVDAREKLAITMPIKTEKVEKTEIDKPAIECKPIIKRCEEIKASAKPPAVSTGEVSIAAPIKIESDSEQRQRSEILSTKETRQVRIILEKIPCTVSMPVSFPSNLMAANSAAPSSSSAASTESLVNSSVSAPLSAPSFARRHSTRQNYLSTTKEYMTREWQLDEIQAEVNQLITDEPCKAATECLEIPKWKTWEFSGTREPPPEHEDLSDEAFRRRHERFLLDERKRKKWDVQRIREQRTIERLKRRHCKDEMNLTNQENEITSFFPPAENLKAIHLTSEYPVSAFGEVIPSISPSEFSLPWHRPPPPAGEISMLHSMTAGPSAAMQLSRANSIAENPPPVSSIAFLSKRRAWRSRNPNAGPSGWKNNA